MADDGHSATAAARACMQGSPTEADRSPSALRCGLTMVCASSRCPSSASVVECTCVCASCTGTAVRSIPIRFDSLRFGSIGSVRPRRGWLLDVRSLPLRCRRATGVGRSVWQAEGNAHCHARCDRTVRRSGDVHCTRRHSEAAGHCSSEGNARCCAEPVGAIAEVGSMQKHTRPRLKHIIKHVHP